jgi:hypothetical protein
LNRHLAGVVILLGADQQVAILAQFVVFLPGIVLHELSHWLTAKVVGVRTGRMTVRPKPQSRGRVQMGSVQVQQSDPVRSSLIGLAPFLVASAVVVVVGRFALGTDLLRESVAAGRWSEVPGLFLAGIGKADALFWVYLIFAVSNAMFPSESDRSAWRPVVIFLALGAIVFYVAGMGKVAGALVGFVTWVMNSLTYAMAITLCVDLLFALLLALLELMASRITQRRVRYR